MASSDRSVDAVYEGLVRELNDLIAQARRSAARAVNLSQMRKLYLRWPTAEIFQTASEISVTGPVAACRHELRGTRGWRPGSFRGSAWKV